MKYLKAFNHSIKFFINVCRYPVSCNPSFNPFNVNPTISQLSEHKYYTYWIVQLNTLNAYSKKIIIIKKEEKK